MIDHEPTKNELLKLFKYKDGDLFNNFDRSSRALQGHVVGSKHSGGYLRLSIDYKSHQAHRLVWIMHNGSIPDGLFIDHINGIRNDNRIENLRLVTRQENGFNDHKAKGYSWNKSENKWESYIKINYKKINLGKFDTESDARQAYLNAKEKFHKIEVRHA